MGDGWVPGVLEVRRCSTLLLFNNFRQNPYSSFQMNEVLWKWFVTELFLISSHVFMYGRRNTHQDIIAGIIEIYA